jgi:hypothetical protein
MCFLHTLAVKSNKIVICYLGNLSNMCSNPHRSCPLFHQYYPLLGHECSEQGYDTNNLLVICIYNFFIYCFYNHISVRFLGEGPHNYLKEESELALCGEKAVLTFDMWQVLRLHKLFYKDGSCRHS